MSTQPVNLTAEPREALGTRSSRRLRRDGKLPAVIYGHGEANASVTLPLKQTVESLQHGAHVLSLDLGGKSEQVFIKDVQYNHLGTEILHIDLFRVNLDEEITSPVQIHLVGEPKGLAVGGILTQMRDTVDVTCRVRDLPDEIRVNVADMDVGDSLHVNELPLPEGVALPPHDNDFTIATIIKKKIRAADEDEITPLTGDEPEVIGDKQSSVQPGEDAPADPNA